MLIDTLHWHRSGSTLEQIRTLPPQWLTYAQLCDAGGPGPDIEDKAAVRRSGGFPSSAGRWGSAPGSLVAGPAGEPAPESGDPLTEPAQCLSRFYRTGPGSAGAHPSLVKVFKSSPD